MDKFYLMMYTLLVSETNHTTTYEETIISEDGTKIQKISVDEYQCAFCIAGRGAVLGAIVASVLWGVILWL